MPVTVTFSEPVTGFDSADITPTNATVANLAGSGTIYTVDLIPAGQGLVRAAIAAGGAADAAGNTNTAATPLSRTYDSVPPSVSMGSSAPNPTNTSPIPVTVTFSESVTGFALSDITVTNATKNNFQMTDAAPYTFDLTPSGQGVVTADIAADVAQDEIGNPNNAAPQFTRTYDTISPTATITLVSPAITSANTIVFRVAFNETVAPTFTSADITQTGTLTGSVNVTGGPTYTVSITPADPNADGTVSFTVGTAVTDLATNPYAGGTSPVCNVFNWNGILVQPQPAQQYTGGTKTLTVTPDCGAGTEIAYQWKWDDGAKTIHDGPTTPEWTIPLSPATNGDYWCEMTYDGEMHESDHVTINIADPLAISPGVENARKYVGDAQTFTANPTGGFTPLHYQWKKGGADISNATNATYAIPSVNTGDAASYSVTVNDSFGSQQTSTGGLQLAEHLAISQSPQDAHQYTGQNFTLTVGTTGGFTPLHYQWKKGASNISSATNATLSFIPVALTDAGAYSVVVNDDVTDTQNSGSGTLQGADITGATLNELTLNHLQSADSGLYAVAVTDDDADSQTSDPATLDVSGYAVPVMSLAGLALLVTTLLLAGTTTLVGMSMLRRRP